MTSGAMAMDPRAHNWRALTYSIARFVTSGQGQLRMLGVCGKIEYVNSRLCTESFIVAKGKSMASAASLLDQIKAGKTVTRHGTNSISDYLWLDGEKITYAKYLGEGDWSYKSFTLEDIADWTDTGDWRVQ